MLALRHAAVIALLFAAGGCDDSLVQEFSGFAKRMCACKNASCAREVQKSFETWVKSKRELEPTDAQMRDLMRVAERYAACWIELIPAAERAKQPMPNLPAEMPEGGLPAEAP